jgi:initiation factor 1A
MKKKPKPSGHITRKVKLPVKDEQFAVVIEMSGGSRLKAMCEDGKTRMVRIGGKFKRTNVGERKTTSYLLSRGLVQV